MQVQLSFASILLLVASPAWFALAQQSSRTGALMSDRGNAGLRGQVKTVLEEHTFSGPDDRLTTTTTQYVPDARILEQRMGTSDGSEWLTSYAYLSDGRLLKTVSGKVKSAQSSETSYSYDEAQRLVGVSGDKIQVRYQYDDKGGKSGIESYDSKPLPPNTIYGAHWEGSDLGFAPYPGGTLTTSYNAQGVATGAELLDAEGTLVGHIVRKFDAGGRVIAEEQATDAPQLYLPEEMRFKLNPEQAKSVGAMIAGMGNSAISYSYDAQGRQTERHRNGGPIEDEVTITTYNDHGDKASERMTMVMNPAVGQKFRFTGAKTMIPDGPPQPAQPPVVQETQYAYRYDGYGNWTELSTAGRSHPDGAFEPGSITRRTLTYY